MSHERVVPTLVESEFSMPTLDELAGAPERALNLSTTDAARLLAQVEGIAAVLRVAAAATSPNGSNGDAPDRLLTSKEAAPRLGLTLKELYRRADLLPFTRRFPTRRPGAKRTKLAFSERGIDRYISGRKSP
jgi:predicted DNA-binding transcriptional regulator AlpA